MVNVLIKPLYEASCWNKTTKFISHPLLMILRRIESNQNIKYIGNIAFFKRLIFYSNPIV